MHIKSWAFRIFIFSMLMIGLPALAGDMPARKVEGNTLISEALPALKLHVSEPFAYIGSFSFTLKNIAFGTRYVFVEADAQKAVKRLVIAQFEGFLPDNDHIYRYDLSSGEMMAGYPFRGNPYAYSNQQAQANNPGGEAALTVRFLRERGYRFDDIWRMYRWLTVPDDAKRHELIVFYLEPEPDPRKTMADFYTPEDDFTPWWREEIRGLEQRARNAWRVAPLK